MKPLSTILILLGCLLIAAIAFAQVPGQLPVENAGFETGDLTGWLTWSVSGSNQIMTTSDAAHQGTYALKATGESVAIYQAMPTPTVGKLYLADGYAMNPSTDPMAAGQELRLEITFFDGSWGKLLEVFSVPVAADTTTDVWQTLMVSGICPEGAVYMNAGFNWIGTGAAGTAGSAYGDDLRVFEMDIPDSTIGNLGFEEPDTVGSWWHWGYLSVSPHDSDNCFIDATYSRTGDYAMKILPQDWNQWTDEWWWGGYYLWKAQTVFDQVDYFEKGDAFYMSAWIMTPSDEQIFGPAYLRLQLNFKDVGGSNVPGGRVNSVLAVDEWSTADEWHFVEAFIECPDLPETNIDKIDLSIMLEQYGEAEGAFYVDDVYMASTPFTQDTSTVEEPPSGKEQLVNGEFGSDSSWTVYQLTDAATATVDFNYTDDSPSAGEGPALNISGGADAHVLVFQQLEMIAGAAYLIDGAFKDIGSADLSCNWCQIYVSTEAPVDGQDYQAIGGTNSDRYVGFESWAGNNGTGLDGTFGEHAHRYAGSNQFIAPGTPGEKMDAYFAIKTGSCGPDFNLLFDNMSLLLIDLPVPDETEMVSNGGFGSDADWMTVKLTSAAAEASIDFNYTADGPSAGEGAALRVSGGTDSHTLVYQPLTLLQGVTYNISGAIKDISGTALDCNWCQVYASTQEPVEGVDYTPTERYLSFDTWEGGGAYSGVGLDGTWENDAYRYGNDSTFVLVPGPLGDEVDVYFGIKTGSCGAAYDWLFDNMSFNYLGVSPTTSVDAKQYIAIPEEFSLNQNYPNPFNPTTTISFNLNKFENVKLTIYDIRGRQVRALLNNKMNQGTYFVIWDGRSNSGTLMASGVYFYTLSVGDQMVTRRMTLIK